MEIRLCGVGVLDGFRDQSGSPKSLLESNPLWLQSSFHRDGEDGKGRTHPSRAVLFLLSSGGTFNGHRRVYCGSNTTHKAAGKMGFQTTEIFKRTQKCVFFYQKTEKKSQFTYRIDQK